MDSVLAAVMTAPDNPVVLQSFKLPQLEENSALMTVSLSEICGTDVHLQSGLLADVPYPLIPGHVSVGRMTKIRGRVADLQGHPFREGDWATFLDVHATCNRCWHCLVAKASTRCPERRVYGITYGVDDGLTGGWAEQIYLKPETRCLRIDASATTRFMAGGCSLPTALHAIERSEIRIGQTVLVLGSGPVGLSSIILAGLSGAGRVLCIGAPDNRLDVARTVGADAILNFQNSEPEERQQWVHEQTAGRGADLTIEATGNPAAAVQAMRWTRDAGRVVVVGQYTDHGPVEFNPHTDLNRKHLDVRGCWGSDFSHFYRAVQLANHPTRASAWEKLPLRRFGLQEINAALNAVREGSAIKALVDPTKVNSL